MSRLVKFFFSTLRLVFGLSGSVFLPYTGEECLFPNTLHRVNQNVIFFGLKLIEMGRIRHQRKMKMLALWEVFQERKFVFSFQKLNGG
jgi:hypothetical protein